HAARQLHHWNVEVERLRRIELDTAVQQGPLVAGNDGVAGEPLIDDVVRAAHEGNDVTAFVGLGDADLRSGRLIDEGDATVLVEIRGWGGSRQRDAALDVHDRDLDIDLE